MHRNAPSLRTARLVKWAALPVALVISGLIIAPASYSAFTATTSDTPNNWAVGTVVLTDNDANGALFTETGLKPGSTGTKCIIVTSSGTLASTVKLYGTAPATTNGLSSNMTMNIVQGSGTTGAFGSCTGFTPLATGSAVYSGSLANFGATSTSFATGLGTWAPTGTASENRTFQITWTVDAGAPNSTQGGTATIGFTWEAQNS